MACATAEAVEAAAAGVWWDAPEEKEFDGGDHEVRCFAWSAQGWTRSLKSAGARALPLR